MATTVKFVTVTYTLKGTPIIERFSTRQQAEERAKQVGSKEQVPVRVM
jgi:hypothetical protein